MRPSTGLSTCPERSESVITVGDTITGLTHAVDDLLCNSEYRILVSAYDSGTGYATEWSDTAWLSESTSECLGE